MSTRRTDVLVDVVGDVNFDGDVNLASKRRQRLGVQVHLAVKLYVPVHELAK